MKWKKETNCFYIIYYKVECSCLYFSRPKHVNVMFVHNLSSTFCLPYTLTMVLPLHIHCHNTELIRNALTQVQKRTCDYSNDGNVRSLNIPVMYSGSTIPSQILDYTLFLLYRIARVVQLHCRIR